MGLELGTSTWFYGREIKVKQLEIMERAGINYFELTSMLPPVSKINKQDIGSDKNFIEIRRYLKSSKLKCWSVHSVGGYAQTDFSLYTGNQQDSSLWGFKKSIELAAALGSKTVVVHPGEGPADGTILEIEKPRRLSQCKEGLNKLVKFAGDLGVKLAVENLSGLNSNMIGSTSLEILEIISDFNPACVGVCADVNHIFREEIDEFMMKLGERVVTLHISDHDGKDEMHWLPAKGVINWANLLSVLKNINYSGPFMYEISPDELPEIKGFKQKLVAMKENYEKLKN